MSMLDTFLSRLFKKKLQIDQPLSKTTANPTIIPRSQHCISRNNISKNALKVLYRLKNCGYDAYLVGGSVRDLLLGGKPKDFDVVTNALPQQIRSLFRNGYIIGRRFRLVHVRFGNGDIIEVATFRAAHNKQEKKSRKRKSEARRYNASASRKNLPKGMLPYDNTYGTQSEDAMRRDFPINALYYNIKDFSVIDYTGGVTDLKEKRIRTIGSPKERYSEDPVRMIRAIRFAAKLGFTLDPETAAPIPELAHLLQIVPNTRLFLETIKLFYTGCAEKAFELSRTYSIFKMLFPETDAALAENADQGFLKLLICACRNTDKRHQENRPLSAGFLFAVMLWPAFRIRMKIAINTIDSTNKKRSEQARNTAITNQLNKATTKTIEAETEHIDLPQHVVDMIRDIWLLQYRMQEPPASSAQQRVLKHPHFKAAYDFLLLRAESGELKMDKLARRWTKLYESFESKKQAVLLHSEPGNRQSTHKRAGEFRRRPHHRHRYRNKSSNFKQRKRRLDEHGDPDGNC